MPTLNKAINSAAAAASDNAGRARTDKNERKLGMAQMLLTARPAGNAQTYLKESGMSVKGKVIKIGSKAVPQSWYDWLWQIAEHGAGPLQGAHALARVYADNPKHADTQAQLQALLRQESRKHFSAAAIGAALSTVALPISVPASLAVSMLLEARLSLSIALLLGHSVNTPWVRQTLRECVENTVAAQADGDAPPSSSTAMQWLEKLTPQALLGVERILLKHGTGKLTRRLKPLARALPWVGVLAAAGSDTRNYAQLAARVTARLGQAQQRLALSPAQKRQALFSDTEQPPKPLPGS